MFFEKISLLKKLTGHAIIDPAEIIWETLDDQKIAYGMFIDLEKAFDTVDRKLLLKKLSYYGIKGTADSGFRSYFQDQSQLVSINGFNSDYRHTKYDVHQGLVLGPLGIF